MPNYKYVIDGAIRQFQNVMHEHQEQYDNGNIEKEFLVFDEGKLEGLLYAEKLWVRSEKRNKEVRAINKEKRKESKQEEVLRQQEEIKKDLKEAGFN